MARNDRRTYRRWLAVAWISFAVTAVCVIVSLSASLPRLQAAYELIDDPAGSVDPYSRSIGGFLRTSKISLTIGVPAVLVFMVARVRCHRLRKGSKAP